MADKGGYTAVSRIEHVAPKDDEKGAEVQVFEPGDSVPEEIAKKLPEGTVGKPSDGQMGSQPFDVTKLPKGHPKRDLIEHVEPPDGDQTRITEADIAIAMAEQNPKKEDKGGDEPLPGEPKPPENPAELPEAPKGEKEPPPRKAPGAAGPPPQASHRPTPPGPTSPR